MALSLLDDLDKLAERTFNTRTRVEILALRAVAQLAQGSEATAEKTLVASVKLAQHSQIIRVFVDLGLRMQQLLAHIAGHRAVAEMVDSILEAFQTKAGKRPFPHLPIQYPRRFLRMVRNSRPAL